MTRHTSSAEEMHSVKYAWCSRKTARATPVAAEGCFVSIVLLPRVRQEFQPILFQCTKQGLEIPYAVVPYKKKPDFCHFSNWQGFSELLLQVRHSCKIAFG